jgi:hypothetical protein
VISLCSNCWKGKCWLDQYYTSRQWITKKQYRALMKVIPIFIWYFGFDTITLSDVWLWYIVNPKGTYHRLLATTEMKWLWSTEERWRLEEGRVMKRDSCFEPKYTSFKWKQHTTLHSIWQLHPPFFLCILHRFLYSWIQNLSHKTSH